MKKCLFDLIIGLSYGAVFIFIVLGIEYLISL